MKARRPRPARRRAPAPPLEPVVTYRQLEDTTPEQAAAARQTIVTWLRALLDKPNR